MLAAQVILGASVAKFQLQETLFPGGPFIIP
jgi:hypothetical protein